MPLLFLFFAMCFSAMLSVMSSLFSQKNPDCSNASTLYTAIVTSSASITWGIIFLSKSEGFTLDGIGYSFAYGLFYVVALVGMFNAYRFGSVSLTAFIKQLSLIGVAVWGFIFWQNPVTLNISVGLILIVAALYLCFMPNKKSEERLVTLKWAINALMLLIGNAGCSIIQKYHQLEFGGRNSSLFMFLAVAISAIVLIFICLKNNRGKTLSKLNKVSLIYPVIGGTSSAILNLFILLLLSTELSESVIFPGIAVGGLILTTLFSVVCYKEKLSPTRWLGLLIGATALVLLNM